jgi:peptidoglycan/LPS O-acetylase OafA/YrhL
MKTIWLGQCDGRRDNNFTTIRLLLAWLVLFGHSFAVTKSGLDPITSGLRLGFVGAIAVDGFFAISGFLVAGSFVRHGSVGFSVARILRIYPGLIVCTALAAFVLGPLVTTLPLGEYFSHPETSQYIKGAALWPTVRFYLPGVFENQPYSRGINGSLWSLVVEVRCYVLMLALGFVGALDGKLRANVVMIALLLTGIFDFEAIPLVGHNPHWARPAAYFVIGALVWVNRRNIPLHPGIALIAIVAPFPAIGTVAFHFVFAPALVYLVFFAAYALPHVDLDRFGDISYGVYIYAWPVQQLMVWSGQGGYVNAALATPFVFALATLSWFLVERPALRMKNVIDRRLAFLTAQLRSRRPEDEAHSARKLSVDQQAEGLDTSRSKTVRHIGHGPTIGRQT